jgi:hypothetical protein
MFGEGAVLKYCPSCGSPAYVSEFLRTVRSELEELTNAKKMPETVLDENGKPLIFERIETPEGQPAPKPMDMTIDLDKIDISREEHLLAQLHTQQVMQTIEMLLGGDDDE